MKNSASCYHQYTEAFIQSSCFLRTARQTDMTTLIVTFRKFAI